MCANPLVVQIHKLFQTEMARENDFLRAQNQVLRDMIPHKRLKFTDRHRRLLVKYGLPVKDRLPEICSIVKPETLLRWHRGMKKLKWDYSKRRKHVGRPCIPPETEQLILDLANENSWGYTRITGELKKLGHTVSPSTVKNVLVKHGLPPTDLRRGLSWKKFIQSHMDVAWACDFFTEEVWSLGGLVTCYVLFFIHLGSRRVFIAGVTPSPNTAWMQQQARNFSMLVQDSLPPCRYLIHDRETSFAPFDAIIESDGTDVVKTPVQHPWCNGFAERFVREARETLDNLILVGEDQLHRAMKEIEKHHNRHRPHQGIENSIPDGYDFPEEPIPIENVRCQASLGGLLNHYYAA